MITADQDDVRNEGAPSSTSANVLGSASRKDRRFHVRPYAASSKRIVSKRGRKNVVLNEVPERDYRYAKDIGNTLVGARWRWILGCVCLVNAVFYFAFAIAWWLVAVFNDDIENDGKSTAKCIMGTKSFTSYLLLSIETLTTTGYGVIYPTECQPCWIILTLQTLTTFAIEGMLVSAVFVKMTRPRNKDSISPFSKKAVISLRDGSLCLIFRLRDIDGKHWAKTTVKAILIHRRTSREGEPLPNYFDDLKLERLGLLFWPQEIVHRITSSSPLWTASPSNIYKSRFEVMVVLEGDSTTTGQPSQTRTSYTNREISWGYRFACCVRYDRTVRKYVIDNEKFNELVECDAPLCSARELTDLLMGGEAILPVEEECDYEWDFDVSPSLSTPMSRASDTSFRTLLKFSNYRRRKGEAQAKQTFDGGVGLETIDSVENLEETNEARELKAKIQDTRL